MKVQMLIGFSLLCTGKKCLCRSVVFSAFFFHIGFLHYKDFVSGGY